MSKVIPHSPTNVKGNEIERAYFGKLGLDVSKWEDPLWRINNIYSIVTDEGQIVRFHTNDAQEELYRNLWYLNVVLKARQLGFTTFIDLLGLDTALFNSNHSVGVIAHSLEDATKIFRNKVETPYKRLPMALLTARPLATDTSKELVFANGSSIGVGTSMRSQTLQFLHVSEFGKISRKYPDKAQEIVTGSFNAVKAGQFIFVESTAEGRDGYFYRMVRQAQKRVEKGDRLTELDFKLHFFPWHKHPGYRIAADGISMPQDLHDYFAMLAADHGIRLDQEQQAWYAKKLELMQDWDDLKREHPSHPEEAFEVANEGVYYRRQLSKMRQQGRIRPNIPVLPGVPVHTFWDLGRNDTTAIWCAQRVMHDWRFVKTYENRGEDITHYVRWLYRAEHDWTVGNFYLPHDAETAHVSTNKSVVDVLLDMKVPAAQIIVVPRIDRIKDGIDATRRMFPTAWIDEEGCAEGLAALENYQAKWDDKLGQWKDEPLHNAASNLADAFRQWGQSQDGGLVLQGVTDPSKRKKPSGNWRTA